MLSLAAVRIIRPQDPLRASLKDESIGGGGQPDIEQCDEEDGVHPWNSWTSSAKILDCVKLGVNSAALFQKIQECCDPSSSGIIADANPPRSDATNADARTPFTSLRQFLWHSTSPTNDGGGGYRVIQV